MTDEDDIEAEEESTSHGFKCPHCGELIPKIKRLCPRNISYTDSKKGTMRQFDKKRATTITSLFDDVYNWLSDKKPNDPLTKNDILQDLDLNDVTSGDDIHQCLNFFICLGNVERYEHNVTIEGKDKPHRYRKTIKDERGTCPFWSRDKKELFRCKCKDFKMVIL